MKSQWNGVSLLFLLSSLMFLVSGCQKPAGGDAKVGTEPVAETSADAGHDLDGWWCSEHGVPEEECSMCSSKAAEKFKAKGDWCKEHDRAESQCFICHPELEAKFAARYEAKFGKKPPKPSE